MKKRIMSAIAFTLCLLIIGCGKGNQNLEEDFTKENLTEENLQNENEQAAELSYVQNLQEGKQICPDFPEVKGLAYVDEQFLLDSICPAVVRLERGNLFGSGVIWKMEENCIWVITNQHILTEDFGTDLLEVVFWDGIRTVGEIAGVSDEYDLGFVKINLQEMGYYTAGKYFQVRHDAEVFKNLNPGDDIFVLGSADYPAGNLYYGTIGNRSVYMDAFGTEMLWAYCEVKAGMSGSGVFDRYGNLLGIVCAGNDKKEAAVLPIDKILAEWETALY